MDPERREQRLVAIRASVGQYLDGIEATAPIFPLGALHLGACLIDVLARLTCDEKGTDVSRYERFVWKYLPSRYQVGDLPKQLYAGVRSVGLHNLSVGRKLALMDGQLDRAIHLRLDSHGRRIIRTDEFVQDLRSAVEAWNRDLDEQDELKERVVKRERRNPVFEVISIEVANESRQIMSTTAHFATDVAVASAAVGPNRFSQS